MKVTSIFLLIALFAVINSGLYGFNEKSCSDYYHLDANDNSEKNQGFSRSFCRSLAIEEGYAQCCYLKYKIGDATYYNCVPVTLSEYYDIDAKIDSLEGQGIDVKSLECTSSSYLYGSFLLLLFILF